MTRLLVFTATFGEGPREETMQSIAAMRFDGTLVHEVSYHNPEPGDRNMANVRAQYDRARQLCLAGGYDGLLTVEHDMEVPHDAAQRMWDLHDADVVYAPYMLRHGSNVLSTWQYVGQNNMGMSLSFYPEELHRYRRRGWGPVSGVGWGCTLIRTHVWRRVIVRGDVEDAGDIAFAADCLRLGLRLMGRFDVPCRHYHNGVWLEAYMQAEEYSKRVLALREVTVSVDGQSVRLIPGKYYTLPGTDASELMRAGYVKITLGAEVSPSQGYEAAVDSVVTKRSKRRGTA